MTVVLLAVKTDKMQAIVKPTRWQRIEFMSRLSTKKNHIYIERKACYICSLRALVKVKEAKTKTTKKTAAVKRLLFFIGDNVNYCFSLLTLIFVNSSFDKSLRVFNFSLMGAYNIKGLKFSSVLIAL